MRDNGFRLLCYNVHDLLDDPSALAHVIRSCRADVACLQEVQRRPFTRRRVLRLARESGLRWSAGGVGSGGTAVFTSRRVDVLAADVVRLPVTGLFTRTRGFSLAQLRLPGGALLTVVSVHLSLRPAERLRHVDLIRQRLRGLSGPYVVAGDLNEPPTGPAWAAFGPLLSDAAGGLPEAGAPTYPSRAPRHRIDAVLLSPRLQVERLAIAGDAEQLSVDDLRAASDHLPLVADLTVLA